MAQEEYNTFFTPTFREFLEPLAQTHFNVEGTIEFSALLFVPGMAPFEQQVPGTSSLSYLDSKIWSRKVPLHSAAI